MLLKYPAVRSQIKCALQKPDRVLQITPALVHLAHTHPREIVFRVGAQYTREHIISAFILAGLEQSTPQHSIGDHVLGIEHEDLPCVRSCFGIAPLFYHTLDTVTIILKG